MKELARAYEPKDIEDRLYRWWKESGFFEADSSSDAPPYCIVIPPPNVTGYLHLGHALVNTLQDVLVRRARMRGFATLWLPGTDHAGIATQLVVKRKLADEGVDYRSLGRDGFLDEVWRWKDKHGSAILHQLEKLGSSCDWSRTRFTMDDDYCAAVRKVFVDAYREGLIYRGPYMVNWCVRCGTALSDLESEHEDAHGRLWSFAYPLADGSGELVVATTRPETMLGDTGVAVAPGDERYARLVGRRVRLPLQDREIPIVADELVDPSFGTGCVKVTPAHDPNDFAMGKRHGLAEIQVIGQDGRMTAEAGARFAGLDRFEAREAVLAALDELGLRRGEKPHELKVAQCQRCGSVVEPLITTQWWMRMSQLAAPALAAVEDGRIRITPDNYRKIYLNWMREIRDWCISRQLWWGHRIPAWHCPDGHLTVSLEDPSACGTCGRKDIAQDEDVLDTWFSSQLWPFATMGWPDRDAADLRKWYPTSVLVTGFDIIFFWVARMITAGLHCMGEVPFREVYLHGLVRDEHGEKMSKVKGNVIDPLEVIDASGADALRFTLAIMNVPARDLPWSPRRMEGYRTFANKLWQAARFAQMNLAGETSREPDPSRLTLADRWILSRLHQTALEVNRAFDEYRFDEASSALYRFIWDELCAWYIEMAKPALQAKDGPLAEEAVTRRRVLLAVLDDSLRLLHPFMPFLTEEIWQHLPHEGETILRAAYPMGDAARVDARALADMERVQSVVTALRNLRAETGIDPKQRFGVRLVAEDAATRELLASVAPLVASLARTEPPEILAASERSGCAVAEAAGVSVVVPLAGVLDVAAERARLEGAIAKGEKELAGLAGRLANPAFVGKAKPEVVAEARARHAELEEQAARLKATLAALPS